MSLALALNLILVAILILAAGLGGYVLAQLKQAGLLEQQSDAHREQIEQLREVAAMAEEDARMLAADLAHSKRQLRHFEVAQCMQSTDKGDAGDPLLAHTDDASAQSAAVAEGRHGTAPVNAEDARNTMRAPYAGAQFARREIA